MKKIRMLLVVSLIIIFSFNTVFAVKYKGDMNEDNKRDIKDVRLLLQEYVNSSKWSPEELKARDMNNDSIIDLMDVRLLLQSYINQDPLEEIPPEAIAVSGVTLNKTSLSLAVGESATLKATFNPTNATNKKVTWSTSDKSIATITSGGKVSGVKEGTATITIKTADGNKTATCKVMVKEAVAQDVKIAVPTFKNKTYCKKELSVKAGTGYTLSGTTKATNAGTYKVQATLQDGYVWSDGTKDVKDLTWKITKAESTIALEVNETYMKWAARKVGGTYTTKSEDPLFLYKVSPRLWYSFEGDGTISAKSSDKKVATIIKDAKENFFTINILEPGQATITVTLSEGTNYSKNTIDFKLLVWKTEYPYTYGGPIHNNLIYEDDNIKAWVENINGVYVTKIWVRDASRQLRKAESNEEAVGLYDDNPASSMHLKTVAQMMQGKAGAVVAFNASGFNLAGSWEGQKKYGGNWDRTPTGHVIITNGVLRRNRSNVDETASILGILNDGTLKLFKAKCNVMYDTMVKAGVVNTINFGGLLISGGEIKAKQSDSRAPRTAFGQIDNHNYVVITTISSRACGNDPSWLWTQNAALDKSTYEIAEIGKALGCKTLFNCDGGGSTSLWFIGQGMVHYGQCMVHQNARTVSDAIYFTN